MVLSDRQTDFGLIFKSTIFRKEIDVRRLEWILKWKHNLPMVNPFVEVCILRPKNREMPNEHVILEWLRKQILRFLLDHGFHLLEYSVLPD